MDDSPDLDDVPDNRDDYLIGLYTEIRQTRRMAENIFWTLLVFALISALTLGWYLLDTVH